MSRFTEIPTAAQTLEAASQWKQRCMLQQRSLFRDDEPCWTVDSLSELERLYVQQPDQGAGSFLERLRTQLSQASPQARQLALELAWLLYLFPHGSILPSGKRQNLQILAELRGQPLPVDHWALQDDVLTGLGATGAFYNTGFWIEFSYAIYLFKALMALSTAEREALAAPDAPLEAWLDRQDFPGELPSGHGLYADRRMFRKIWLYLMQPDLHERIISAEHRRQIVKALAPMLLKQAPDLGSQAGISAQLARIRRTLETSLGTTDLDYYLPPVVGMWNGGATPKPDDDGAGGPLAAAQPAPGPVALADEHLTARYGPGPRNLVFHGPPGTGKTFELQTHVLPAYEDQADAEPEDERLRRVAADLGWFEVLAAALVDAGQPLSVPQLGRHRFVKARMASAASQTNVGNRLWSILQSHTVESCTTVQVDKRIKPLVFDKDAQSFWRVMPAWLQVAPQVQEAIDALRGPASSSGEPSRRYEMVTFHPSYTYEDFVEGLRPRQVVDDEGRERVEILPEAGPLKRVCERARRHPGQRFALVIDEINRGNIAKIFGELITLVEDDKRLVFDAQGELIRGLQVQLPYTRSWFGVPANVDVYGTMNTSDRSIALVDLALRRRFRFKELMPRPDVIRGGDGHGCVEPDDDGDPVDLRQLLRVLNARLTVLRGREATIGHAYFNRVVDMEGLRDVFRDAVVPLLQEHFFEDWGRIQQVLAVPRGVPPFLESDTPKVGALFHGQTADLDDLAERPIWRLARAWPAESFRGLYEGLDGRTLSFD